MEYTDFIIDLIDRTEKNFEKIKEIEKKEIELGENIDVFPITQLINSTLALLVIPKEWGINLSLTDKKNIENEFLKHNLIKNTYSTLNFSDWIRHIRNAISHGYIYCLEENNTLSSIKFCDKKTRGKNIFPLTYNERKEFDEAHFDFIFEVELEKFIKIIFMYARGIEKAVLSLQSN